MPATIIDPETDRQPWGGNLMDIPSIIELRNMSPAEREAVADEQTARLLFHELERRRGHPATAAELAGPLRLGVERTRVTLNSRYGSQAGPWAALKRDGAATDRRSRWSLQ